MRRLDLFIKVEVDLGAGEQPERLAAEICRRIMKVYGVHGAEMTNYVEHEEDR